MSMSRRYVFARVLVYAFGVPKLWTQTVEAHRHEVRQAIMDTTSALVSEQGLRSVTMSEIAEKTGIGRATLYKYFPDVETILHAWHQRHIDAHINHLTEVRERATTPTERLETVLAAHALHIHETRSHHETELAALVHRGEHVAQAQRQLKDFIKALITDAAKTGSVRNDAAPSELTEFCIHAVGAAQDLASKAAVERLVSVTLGALQPHASRHG
jgi:AcrR family transcriptional regulator